MEREILRYQAGDCHVDTDHLAEEEPLEIRVAVAPISVTMRTPGHEDELAAGFLLSEAIIHKPTDVLKIEPCDRNEFGNLINVVLAPDVDVDFARLTRHVFATSSCGLCGKATIESIRERFEPIADANSPAIAAETLLKLPDLMARHSRSSMRPAVYMPPHCSAPKDN